jgi:hypothetical protein
VLRSYHHPPNLVQSSGQIYSTCAEVRFLVEYSLRGNGGGTQSDRRSEMGIEYSISNMDIGKVGPCMVPGHRKYHKLELNPCWSTMRRFLHDNSWAEFMKRVEEK